MTPEYNFNAENIISRLVNLINDALDDGDYSLSPIHDPEDSLLHAVEFLKGRGYPVHPHDPTRLEEG